MLKTRVFNDFDIPDIYYFEAGNYFTGSRKDMNYKIVPDGETMKVTVWHGFICSELAEPETENQFPVTKAGHQTMLDWLTEIYQQQT